MARRSHSSRTPRPRPPAPRSRQFERPSLSIPATAFACSVCLLLAAVAKAEEAAPAPLGGETDVAEATDLPTTDLATAALGSAALRSAGLEATRRDSAGLIDAAKLLDTDLGDAAVARWADRPLVLNGRGTRHSYRRIVIRDVAFKVYVAELYVPEPTGDSEQIIYDYPTIEIRFTFHRNVSPSELRKSAGESFRKLLPSTQQYRAHAENREKFVTYMASSGLKKGDRVVLRFSDAAVQIKVNGRRRGTIESHDFQQLARRIWLDEPMPDRGLRDLRLGLLDHRAITRQQPTTSTISAAGQ